MKGMTYRGYAATIEFDGGDGIFVGRIVGVNDVVGFHAESVDDLKTAFHEAVDDYIASAPSCGRDAFARPRAAADPATYRPS